MTLELDHQLEAARGGSIVLVVQHTHERSGWVTLPPALCSQLFASGAGSPLALELRRVQHCGSARLPSPDAPPLYAAWGGTSCAAGCVGVPRALARSLGLAEGAEVAVRPLPATPEAESVTVEPAGADDWEVVEANAAYLESSLLSQVGVASLRQPLPCWIRNDDIMLRVTGMVPEVPVARLVPGTEVHVAPQLRVQPSDAAAAARGGGTLLAPAVGKRQQQQGTNGHLSSQQQQRRQQGEQDAAAPLQAVLRVQQISSRDASSLRPPAPVAEQRQQQQQEGIQLPPSVQLVAVRGATLERCGLRPGDWVRLAGRNCRSLVKFACLAASDLAGPGHLALTAEQCEWAGAPPFSHIRLQRLTREQRSMIVEAAELQRSSGSRTSGSSRNTLGATLGRPGDGAQQKQEQAQQEQEQGEGEAEGPLVGTAALAESGWLRPAAEAALRHLLPVLGFTPRSLLQSWGSPRPGGLLVTGPAGSGKSALLAATAAALRRHPECLTHCVTVSCREISAEGASQAQAQLLPKVLEALDHLPSLLVLDDLDVLCPAESAGADGAPSSADPALVAWLSDLLDHLAAPSAEWGRLPPPKAGQPSARNDGSNGSNGATAIAGGAGAAGGRQRGWGSLLWPPLAVAATCKDAASLAAPLRVAGRLDHEVSLPPPTADSRAAILAAAAHARGAHLEPRHLRAVAEQADGFDAADLEVLLDRALHVAVRRQLAGGSSGGDRHGSAGSAGLQVVATKDGPGGAAAAPPPLLRLTREDMAAALEGFTPAAFWGTGSRKLVQAGVEGWADVGGMEEARGALHEALELPIKHARLVAKAPLRLRTGVLLYGPPGCGKTHIVAAAVAAANVRCITVSGPELLNKYIGASEAAVRDVFQRAAAAAPSVLFFDEFDAIAPQRGHDNTGVTDRVVNQLLTELDGVEGLRGVCVVAATSRPDLIDAALLRPGRLDRLVFCGFPSPLERGHVLRALSRGVQLAPDVDLDLVGYNAEFCSGADLGALLAEAQLAAVHEALEAAEGPAAGVAATAAAHRHGPTAPPIIQRRHLEAALAAARPSVPEAERERLEAIYARFRQDREPGSGGGGGAAADKGKGKLVSWA